MEFPLMNHQDMKELKLLIKYSITLVSLINLNSLAEGFNQNRNILNLHPDDFISFSKTNHFSSFQKIINFKRTERYAMLKKVRQDISNLNSKNLIDHNAFISQMLKCDYRETNFQ